MYDLRVGDVIDTRFELLGFAGAGGMGAVFRALDRTLGRVVALKLVDPLGDDDAARIQREAELLASIDHPGVVRCLDHGVTRAGARFLVMEWVTGVDLESWLARGKLSWEHALQLARRVAEALAAVHARGVVHRDIKPANLLLVDDSVDAVKLVDFGVAGEVDDLEHSDPGMIVGTPGYMAPEALRGDPVDARADVYGLGAVLFRALAGRAVFTGAQRLAILAKVLLEVPPPICDLRSDVPIEMEELLGRMLAKDPARRPPDGAAMVRALRDVEAADPVDPGVGRKRAAVTFGEQRVTCIVLCGRRARAEVTVRIKKTELSSLEHVDVERAASKVGGVLEVLPSGSLLIHFDSGTPAERATRAASCALAVAGLRPGTSIVVATGVVVKSGPAAVGQVIDRAAAELATSPPGVWVDPTTAALLDQRFAVEDRAAAAIDLTTSGNWRVHEPWKQLVGEQQGAIAPVRLFMGKPSPCVGRAAELTTLEAVLDDAWTAPRARVVLLTAPPGIGKSRLVRELLSRAREATVIGARGELVRAGAPFGLASRLLAHATGIADTDDVQVRRGKLVDFDVLAEIAGAPAPADVAGPSCSRRAPIRR